MMSLDDRWKFPKVVLLCRQRNRREAAGGRSHGPCWQVCTHFIKVPGNQQHSGVDPDPDWFWLAGSGSRWGKNDPSPHKKVKKWAILCTGCPEASFGRPLFSRLGINVLQILISNLLIRMRFRANLTWWIRICIETNAHPQDCFRVKTHHYKLMCASNYVAPVPAKNGLDNHKNLFEFQKETKQNHMVPSYFIISSEN